MNFSLTPQKKKLVIQVLTMLLAILTSGGAIHLADEVEGQLCDSSVMLVAGTRYKATWTGSCWAKAETEEVK